MECKQLLSHVLKLERERGHDGRVTQIPYHLFDTDRQMGLHEEGMQQVKEALEIFGRLGGTMGQARCLVNLAWLLRGEKQLDAAEEAASRAISLILEKSSRSLVYESHRILGGIYQSKGEIEKAIHHFEIALEIASSFNCHGRLFLVHCSLAALFRDESKFDDANVHLELAKSHMINRSAYNPGRATGLQAGVRYRHHR